jgi:hypothetical protein
LAQAWGADLRRWPQQEQAAAQELLALPASAAAALASLDRAEELDRLLDAYVVDAPGAALVDTVLADVQVQPAGAMQGRVVGDGRGKPSAHGLPRQGRAGGHRLWHWWWSGAGIAGVGLAGAAAGALAVALLVGTVLPTARPVQSEAGWWSATAFDAGGAFVEGSEE